jgi:hypothetical protein
MVTGDTGSFDVSDIEGGKCARLATPLYVFGVHCRLDDVGCGRSRHDYHVAARERRRP